MTILYPAPAPVKSARHFGAGILASRPTYRAPYNSADLAWLIEGDARREIDREADAMAEEADAMARLELGLCC